MERKNTLSEQINEARKYGFINSFNVKDGLITCKETNKTYRVEELKITGHYRFEGSSNPSDMSVLYLIESHDGNKGTIVDAFGTYQDKGLDGVIENIPKA